MQEAQLYFGSTLETRETFHEVRNPYTGELVTKRADSTKEDALRMLEIAKSAKKSCQIFDIGTANQLA